MTSDDAHEPETPPSAPVTPAPRPWRILLAPTLVLTLGVMALCALSVFELRAQDAQPWSRAIFAADGEPLWDGTTVIHVRRLPVENYTALDATISASLKDPAIQAEIPNDILPMMEKILGMDLSDEEWAPLLASGRPPRPNAHEAVAGHLARFDTFTMDGVTYTVTGRIWRSVAGLANTYVIPYQGAGAVFREDTGATTGWLDRNGLEGDKAEKLNRFEQHRLRLHGGTASNSPALILAAIMALGVMAAAGSVAHIRLLRLMAMRRDVILGPVLEAAQTWPRMFAAFHVFFYGCVVASMSAALLFPRANLMLTEVFQWTFSQGGLSAIGSAYESGNILRAAWATFEHNFIVATVGVAIIPSLFIFFSGFVINAIRFCVVGLGLSPVFAGSITHFTYHSVTMVLELEAYIVASFIIVLWPIQIVVGAVSGNTWREWRRGLEILASGTALVGIMLAIAALFEATTLILLR